MAIDIFNVDNFHVERLSMAKAKKYRKFFMDVALRTALMSYAKRAKVGSVLVKDNRIVATSWNGTPSLADNCCEHIDINGSLVTNPNVIHSEANAICFCAKHGIKTDGAELYVTLSPCAACALAIVQAGIKAVYYHEEYCDTTGLKLLQSSNVKTSKL